MALHWNIEKCKNVEEIKSEKEWGVTHNLIWITLAVGLGEISEKNWKEFLLRIKLLEKVDGAFLFENIPTTDPPQEGKVEHKPIYYTPEMVKKRIGLYTNVGEETRASWLKRYIARTCENIEREIEQESKEKPSLKIVK